MSKTIEIKKFMIKSLSLNGNALVLFAIIWGESKQGTQIFTDDYVHHSEAMNVSIPTYYNTLQRLVDRGIIFKVDGGYKVSGELNTTA